MPQPTTLFLMRIARDPSPILLSRAAVQEFFPSNASTLEGA